MNKHAVTYGNPPSHPYPLHHHDRQRQTGSSHRRQLLSFFFAGHGMASSKTSRRRWTFLVLIMPTVACGIISAAYLTMLMNSSAAVVPPSTQHGGAQDNVVHPIPAIPNGAPTLPPPQPKCNFEAFRKLVESRPDGYLPGTGAWTRRTTINGSSVIDRFQPDFCRLTYGAHVPYDAVRECVHRQKLRYIVIHGDSNGRNYYWSLYRLLSGTADGERRCSNPQKHQTLTAAEYFAASSHVVASTLSPNGNRHVEEQPAEDAFVVHRCPCGDGSPNGVCVVEFTRLHPYHAVLQAKCRVDDDLTVVIEYTTVQFAIDPKYLYTNRTGCQSVDKRNTSTNGTGAMSFGRIVETTADSTQKFLLAEFHADPRPDLLLVFGDAHDRSPLAELAANIDRYARLIDDHVDAASTRMVWISRLAEDTTRKPAPWNTMRYDNGTLTRLQWLDAANRLMYSKMRRRFLDAGKPLLFPDVLAMSTPVLDEFSIDGVHMRDLWYDVVVSFLLQSTCNI